MWLSAALVTWLALAVRHAWRAGRAGAGLARDGDEWYLADLRGGPVPGHPGRFGRDDPLTLERPRYRSSWLVVLELRDAAGRTRTLDVWADAVDPALFSHLHLACLFDVPSGDGLGNRARDGAGDGAGDRTRHPR